MKFNLKRYISSPDILKGGLLASLFGLLPTIGLGAEYLFINVTHGIDSPRTAAWAKDESRE